MSFEFSNFQLLDRPIIDKRDGIAYRTVEHFYQAMKTLDRTWRARIASAPSPGESKRLGRRAPMRGNWDTLKLDVMEYALRRKFAPSTSHHNRLVRSSGEIVEYNQWHDNFWGVCVCSRCSQINGSNHLGKLLMKIRSEHQ